jgi:hypothetical protein
MSGSMYIINLYTGTMPGDLEPHGSAQSDAQQSAHHLWEDLSEALRGGPNIQQVYVLYIQYIHVKTQEKPW